MSLVLASFFSVAVAPAAAVGGATTPSNDRLIKCAGMYPCENGEKWGTAWVRLVDEPGSMKDCYGRGALGYPWDGYDWGYANSWGVGTCTFAYRQELGPFWEDPGGGSSRVCYCQHLECPYGMNPIQNNMTGMMACPPQPPPVTRIETCLDLILGVSGGMSGNITKSVIKKTGSFHSQAVDSKQSSSIASTVESHASETGLIATLEEKFKLDSSISSTFAAAMSSTWNMKKTENSTYAFTLNIDLSKPLYWYRTTIKLFSADDVLVSLLGNADMNLNAPAKASCVYTDIDSSKLYRSDVKLV